MRSVVQSRRDSPLNRGAGNGRSPYWAKRMSKGLRTWRCYKLVAPGGRARNTMDAELLSRVETER